MWHLPQCWSAFLLSGLTHLTLIHVPGTLVVVWVGDEVGHDTEHAVWEELLVCGHPRLDLILHDAHIDVKLMEGKGGGREEGKKDSCITCLISHSETGVSTHVWRWYVDLKAQGRTIATLAREINMKCRTNALKVLWNKIPDICTSVCKLPVCSVPHMYMNK